MAGPQTGGMVGAQTMDPEAMQKALANQAQGLGQTLQGPKPWVRSHGDEMMGVLNTLGEVNVTLEATICLLFGEDCALETSSEKVPVAPSNSLPHIDQLTLELSEQTHRALNNAQRLRGMAE